MDTVTILSMEFPFDVFDIDCAQRYENAMRALVKEMEEIQKQEQKLSFAESLRRQCASVCGCFDAILGEGASDKLFGGQDNLKTCLKAFGEFANQIEKQKEELGQCTAALGKANRAAVRPAKK